MGKGSTSAPKPDPMIGMAAMKSAETGEKWLEVAKEQFGIANERQAKLDDLTSQVTNSQLTAQNNANTWAAEDRDRYKTVFQPMEDAFIDKAKNWDSPEKQAQAAAEAKGDVMTASAQAEQARQRQMGGMGINPASGRFAATERGADTATALASAGAQNNARTTLKNQAVALQADAANMGRGLPSQATQALGLGVQTGNSVVGNNVSANNAWGQGVGILQSGYSTAMQGYGQQANILNNLYRNQLAGWQAEQELSAGNAAGIGQAAGTIAGLLFKSDADAKEDKKPAKGMLQAVRGLPVQEWSYKPGEGDGGRHIGTYAQDFQRETGKGDGRSIPVIDAIGVTMGAIKELDKKVDRLAKGRGIGPMPRGGVMGLQRCRNKKAPQERGLRSREEAAIRLRNRPSSRFRCREYAGRELRSDPTRSGARTCGGAIRHRPYTQRRGSGQDGPLGLE